MNREEYEARHKIFKEHIYPLASLPWVDFGIALSKVLDKHPEIIDREPKEPIKFNRSAFRNFMKTWRF